jgi:hypothetical protein
MADNLHNPPSPERLQEAFIRVRQLYDPISISHQYLALWESLEHQNSSLPV